MPKMKTKSAAKKRFKITGSGKVVAYPTRKRHNLTTRSSKFIRSHRGPQILSEADSKGVKKFLPYDL